MVHEHKESFGLEAGSVWIDGRGLGRDFGNERNFWRRSREKRFTEAFVNGL
jgi:hypothetical protein